MTLVVIPLVSHVMALVYLTVLQIGLLMFGVGGGTWLSFIARVSAVSGLPCTSLNHG